jgi:hypothetical protein
MPLISRRGLLGHGAASIALVPAIARAASTGAELPQTPPTQGQDVQGAADAFDHLTVDTFVNGKGPFRFVVDTGADRTVIGSKVAEALGLLKGEGVTVQGIARAVTAPTVQIARLQVGPFTLEDIKTPVLQRAMLGSDGYLGLDILDGHAVTFDFHARRLTVGASALQFNQRDVVSADEYVVRANGSNGRLMAVNCKVGDVRAHAFIDSGAEMSIGNRHLFAELQKSGATYISDIVVPVMGVTGGAAEGRLTYVDQIQFGAVAFNRSVLLICDLEVFDVWGLADEPAMFIGMNFLRQTSAVTIDYGRKQILFKLAEYRMASRA